MSSSSSSKDSESSHDEENHAEQTELQEQRILYLKEELAQTPNDFKKAMELVQILRSTGELEQVRQLRNDMSKRYPLPEDLWLEWILDEQRLVSSDAEREAISQLYMRATTDYLSVNLWLSWIQWDTALAEENKDVESVRQRYEAALMEVGLHVQEGHRVWQAYVAFEKELLGTDTKQEQLDRIRRIYKRSLSIPLADMKQRMDEYVHWEGTLEHGLKCSFKKEYDQALVAYQERLPFEEKISDSAYESPDYGQLDTWWQYLKFEEERDDLARVRCLYERAVKNYFLVFDLWCSYLAFMQNHLKHVGNVLLPLCKRAVRNYPYTPYLWTLYLREMERSGKPRKDISDVFEEALVSGMGNATDYIELFKSFIDFIARTSNSPASSGTIPLATEVRANLARAVEFLGQYFPEAGDELAELKIYWAMLETYMLKDMEAAMTQFEALLTGARKGTCRCWLDAIRANIHLHNNVQARTLFRRGYTALKSTPAACRELCHEWVVFESLFGGSLNDWELANNHLQEINLLLNSQPLQEQQHKQDRRRVTFKTRDQESEQDVTMEDSKGNDLRGKKRKKVAHDDSFDEQEARRKRRKKTHNSAVDEYPRSKQARGREDHGSVHQKNNSVIHVSNLPNDTDADLLKSIFQQFGSVLDARLVYAQSKFKGFGYVEFVNEDGAFKAIQHANLHNSKGDRVGDEQAIKYKDQEISVAPAHALRPGTVLPSVRQPPTKQFDDKLTLFVKNLAYCTTDDELKTFLESQSGATVAQTRIVRHRATGQSRGFAYVQFSDQDNLNKVLETCKDKVLHNFALQIEVSAPPVEDKGFTAKPSTDVKRPPPENESRWSKYAPDPQANLDLGNLSSQQDVLSENKGSVSRPKLRPRVIKQGKPKQE